MKKTGKRTVVQHAFALRSRYPGARVTCAHGTVTWTGRLQPTPASRSYLVRIEYSGRGRPRVRVLDPPLVIPEGKVGLPHVYPGQELCLFYPGEWDGDVFMADTIVPWAAEWLFFYELWLATGKWHGGGREPLGLYKDADVVARLTDEDDEQDDAPQ